MAARAGAAAILLLLTAGALTTTTARSMPPLPAANATSAELADGLMSYLEDTPEYSNFYAVYLNLVNTTSFSSFQGGTGNHTVLLPNNTVIHAGFAELATDNGIREPDTFFDRLLQVADINYRPPNFQGGTEIPASNEEAAGIVLYGFAKSHVLRGAYDFYDNDTILGAPYQVPINISTDLSLSFDAYESNLLAFGADNAPGPESAYLRAPYGLLNVDIGVELPHDHLTAVNGTSTLLVYDIERLFIFSGRFLPADVGVDCTTVPNLPPNTNCGSVKGALAQLAAMKF